MSNNTKIIKCVCKYEFQDKLYGLGYRVMNLMAKMAGTKKQYRCTVCGKVHVG
jgi:hypothetical protein